MSLLLTTVDKQNEQHRLKIWLRCTVSRIHKEAKTEWIKLHTDEFPMLYCTPNTAVVISAQKISLRIVSGNNFRDSDHGVHSFEYTHIKIQFIH